MIDCKYATRNEWGPIVDCDHPKSTSGHCAGKENCKLYINKKGIKHVE